MVKDLIMVFLLLAVWFFAIAGMYFVFFSLAEKRECELNLPRGTQCTWQAPKGQEVE